MNQAAALKRLEVLEAQAQVTRFDRVLLDPESRTVVETYAKDLDVSVEIVIAQVLRIAPRVAEVGQDTADRELAAELGVTVMDLRSKAWFSKRQRRWQEYKEWGRARRTKIVHWRQGVMYRGGVPVTD